MSTERVAELEQALTHMEAQLREHAPVLCALVNQHGDARAKAAYRQGVYAPAIHAQVVVGDERMKELRGDDAQEHQRFFESYTQSHPWTPEEILLDLDGVCCDFYGAAVKRHGRDPAWLTTVDLRNQHVSDALGLTFTEFWKPMLGDMSFWTDLEPTPWFTQLWQLLTSLAPVTIVTAPSSDPMSAAGKMAWIYRHIRADYPDISLDRRKYRQARSRRVLIDDRPDQVRDFRQAGGFAVLVPGHLNDGRLLLQEGPEVVFGDIQRQLNDLRHTPPIPFHV